MTYSGTLTPAGNTYGIGNLNAANGFSNSTIFTVSGPLSGTGNSLVISGISPIYLHRHADLRRHDYGKPRGALGFRAIRLTNLARAASPSARTLPSWPKAGMCPTPCCSAWPPPPQHSRSSPPMPVAATAWISTDFPNASLAFWDNVGTQTFAFNGPITPGGNGYLFGSSRAANYINLTNADALTGANSLTVVPGSISKLKIAAANDFTGDTLIDSGTLYITNDLALPGQRRRHLRRGHDRRHGGHRADLRRAEGEREHHLGHQRRILQRDVADPQPRRGRHRLIFGRPCRRQHGGHGADQGRLGTQVLCGTDSYTGSTTVSAGTLALGPGGSLGNTASPWTAGRPSPRIPATARSPPGRPAGTAGATLTLDQRRDLRR